MKRRWKPTVMPKPAEQVERRQQAQVNPIHGDAPEQRQGNNESDERDDHSAEIGQAHPQLARPCQGPALGATCCAGMASDITDFLRERGRV